MEFLYAISNVNTVTAKTLTECGLDGTFAGRAFSQRAYSSGGPGGDKCVLITAGEAKHLFYKPEEQKWQKSADGKYRIGIQIEEPPTPNELSRKKQLAGHYVELADGNEWLIPVARVLTGGAALPQALILGANGEVFAEELTEYAMFSDAAQKLWGDFEIENKVTNGMLTLDIAARMKLAIEALAYNYFIGAEEVNMLRLITSQNLGEIMAAIIDIPTLIEVSEKMLEDKKKVGHAHTEDGSSSGSGIKD